MSAPRLVVLDGGLEVGLEGLSSWETWSAEFDLNLPALVRAVARWGRATVH